MRIAPLHPLLSESPAAFAFSKFDFIPGGSGISSGFSTSVSRNKR